MEVEIKMALLDFTRIVLVVFGCALPANLIEVDQRSLFRATLMKNAEF